jgi:hypothetical protein
LLNVPCSWSFAHRAPGKAVLPNPIDEKYVMKLRRSIVTPLGVDAEPAMTASLESCMNRSIIVGERRTKYRPGRWSAGHAFFGGVGMG